MPTIPQTELRNNSEEILRRAESGERFIITVDGRPVADLGSVSRQWVSTNDVSDLWRLPVGPALDRDIEAYGGDLRDPWDR